MGATTVCRADTRRLISGRTVVDGVTSTALTLATRCPEKWVCVDLETGECWTHDGHAFLRASAQVRAECATALAAGEDLNAGRGHGA
jgi:hypothetical protein